MLYWHSVDVDQSAVALLLARYQLRLVELAASAAIPGSYWGGAEAGLIGETLYLRPDTPLHSLLHEACHYICMTPARRALLHTDAGGSDIEESAVCYLQILLAEQLQRHGHGVGSDRLLQDMDDWGYSFRLGSSRAWFEQDAADAADWLLRHRLIVEQPGGRLPIPSWQRRLL